MAVLYGFRLSVVRDIFNVQGVNAFAARPAWVDATLCARSPANAGRRLANRQVEYGSRFQSPKVRCVTGRVAG